MVELHHQGISIDDDNDPVTYNVPRQCETTDGTGNWRKEDIIFPQKSENLQDSFNYLIHCSHDAILSMLLHQFFFVMFPEEYPEEVLIPETKKWLSVPMDIEEFIK